ncbi:gastrin/cholecystokinin-like peptide isoform X1 [Xenopus laevis]|uniref:Gastrin/cholecystokinin-like peptide isoform X1 n=3 Tax=Xenopus laevis TaxID=8355 RepID=A0A8J1LT20_XENLA|nr:gastrin/cholecystokinin-like peptide isoform X1 [Xenopus laevis]
MLLNCDDFVVAAMHNKCYMSVLLAVLAAISLCRPMTDLQSAHDGSPRKTPGTSSELSRRDLLASLSHEQRQLISQLLPHLYTDLSNSQTHFHPVQDRDYAGWMDFGRRSLEEPES